MAAGKDKDCNCDEFEDLKKQLEDCLKARQSDRIDHAKEREQDLREALERCEERQEKLREELEKIISEREDLNAAIVEKIVAALESQISGKVSRAQIEGIYKDVAVEGQGGD